MVFITTKKAYFDKFHEKGVLGLIVEGNTGVGKSSYAIKVLAQLYGKLKVEEDALGNKNLILEEPNWDAWERQLVFLPEDFLRKLKEAAYSDWQLPALVWDDAGAWANKYLWYTPVAQQIASWLKVVRTSFACIMFTTPDRDDLFAAIRDFPDNRLAMVRKYTKDEWRREVNVYKRWKSTDDKKRGVKHIYTDRFNCRLPDSVYEAYRRIRKEYVKILVDELERTMQEHEVKRNEFRERILKMIKERGYLDADVQA